LTEPTILHAILAQPNSIHKKRPTQFQIVKLEATVRQLSTSAGHETHLHMYTPLSAFAKKNTQQGKLEKLNNQSLWKNIKNEKNLSAAFRRPKIFRFWAISPEQDGMF
jgi:hypothetical protein